MPSSGNYFTGIARQWAIGCAEQISLVQIATIVFSEVKSLGLVNDGALILVQGWWQSKH
jgi:hypothetical protein